MRSGLQLALQFIPEVLGVRAMCRPVEFSHTKLGKPFVYGPGFPHKGHYCLQYHCVLLEFVVRFLLIETNKKCFRLQVKKVVIRSNCIEIYEKVTLLLT